MHQQSNATTTAVVVDVKQSKNMVNQPNNTHAESI
jgi:hypothetical protein